MRDATSPHSARRAGHGLGGVFPSGRVLFFLAFALLLFAFVVSWTLTPSVPPPLRICHSVTTDAVPPDQVRGLNLQCDGKPVGYADKWLWLHHDLTAEQQDWPDWSMNMHFTRFQDLVVNFHFNDGSIETHRVRSGDFGRYWTPNGYLAFSTRGDAGQLEAISLGINRLASWELIRLRLVQIAQQERAVQLTATLVGAALSFLTVSLFYNLFITFIARQRKAIWHCAWVLCMIAWGLCWSQLILIVAPQLAGSTNVRICSILATGAIVFASQYMLVTLEKGTLPWQLGTSIFVISALTFLLCLASAFAPPGMATLLADIFRFSTLITLALVVVALALGLYRGSYASKDFALAWSLPVMAVLSTFSADTSATVPVVSGELMVLGTSALQTLWLSFAATRGFATLRAERDHARAMQSELMVLAETDPLTKLYNRRGMMERFQRELAKAHKSGNCLGLMVIDIDHFKSINDTFGHEVGDHVLQHVANLLGLLRKDGAIVARFGGEEFCIIMPGKARHELRAMAEHARTLLADADMSQIFAIPNRGITASFGVIDTLDFPGSDPGALLREADQALYQAKAQGRNRVVVARPAEDAAGPSRETAEA